MWVRCGFNVGAVWVQCGFGAMWLQGWSSVGAVECGVGTMLVEYVWVECRCGVGIMWVQGGHFVSILWVQYEHRLGTVLVYNYGTVLLQDMYKVGAVWKQGGLMWAQGGSTI